MAVVGAGVSGLAAARLLLALGAVVRIVDDRLDLQTVVPSGVDFQPLVKESLVDVGLVVLSPGVPRTHPALVEADHEGRLVGEVELASWFIDVPLIGVTGTNGKSTTTALLGHIFQRADRRVFIGGNFGTPLSELALGELRSKAPTVDFAVVELSSYQLESVERLRLWVAVWLNIEPDHLDRYPGFEAYVAAKAQIFQCVAPDGLVVASGMDPVIAHHAEQAAARVRWFRVGEEEAEKDGTMVSIRDAAARRGDEVYLIRGAGLLGEHNYENAAAAIEVGRFVGISSNLLQKALDDYSPLEHRLKLVHVANDVRWFDDSKATNIAAAVRAVKAMDRPTILILGGRDKGGSWTPLVEATGGRVSRVLVIGEASSIIVQAFGSSQSVETAGTLEQAVRRAFELAQPGYAVLLAPACSAFDQFANYVERGDVFIRLARAAGCSQ
ncbi:MAG: UDP-N-acetylmuramoyl-L-alanine--D-glutamate ligase [Myxococcales bacterium]|nr:UDP-N-acetylmuramoyl-L-alanine--D-glutamate ligase [Myxococcales bacterium]